ncbi:MAG: DUF1565 domain-containing protein, partial [Myxococcales bacterium]|nr:DUF1565 domain-containing protein [Myxococcales bacterium]
MKVRIAIVTSLSVVCAGTVHAQSRIYVDPAYGGPEDGSAAQPFNTIGEAIDAAQTGDTIDLAAGTYSPGADFALPNAVTIEGKGRDLTTVNAGFEVRAPDAGTALRFEAFAFTTAAVAMGLTTPAPIFVQGCRFDFLEIREALTYAVTLDDCDVAGDVRFATGDGTVVMTSIARSSIGGSVLYPHGEATGSHTVEGSSVGGDIAYQHGASDLTGVVRNCQVDGSIVIQSGRGATNVIATNTVGGNIEDNSGGNHVTIADNHLPHGDILDRSGRYFDDDTGGEDEIIERNRLDDGIISPRGLGATLRDNVIVYSGTDRSGIDAASGAFLNLIGNTVTVPYQVPPDVVWYDIEWVCAIS